MSDGGYRCRSVAELRSLNPMAEGPVPYHERTEVVTFMRTSGRYFWGLDIPGTDRRVCGIADTEDEAWQIIREYKQAGELAVRHVVRTRRGGIEP